MSLRVVGLAVLFLTARLAAFAQDRSVITMDEEPHHHLVLQNDYVKVFNVEVSPGDSIVLHRHDEDTVAIAIGDQVVTVGIPGKPDVHSKNADAQVRLQRSGYMHSTRVDGDTPYHTVAVELLRPQTNFHNVCGEVLVGQPLNCSPSAKEDSSGFSSETLLESGETEVRLVRVHPHQTVSPGNFPFAAVIVALDPATIPSGSPKRKGRFLQAGEFVWLESRHGRPYLNQGDNDARFIEIRFPHAE
jgi:uncharacterized Zn-binding protein involved in type VI secretion